MTQDAKIHALRFMEAWDECLRHIHHLNGALVALAPLLPLQSEVFASLSDARTKDLDQFIYRYTKLQDAMGERLFPAILQYLQEPYEERPMLDKLGRLEKLNFIPGAEAWQDIRNIRNKLAHEYPEESEKNAALINLAHASARQMYAILSTIEGAARQLKTGALALKKMEPAPALREPS